MLILSGCNTLKILASTGTVRVELRHEMLALENVKVIRYLKSLQPIESVSWSNVIDYLDIGVFHHLAKTIGHKDCIHFGYSLNWTVDVFGVNLLDYYQHPAIVKDLFRIAVKNIALRNQCDGTQDFLVWPPPDNPLNFFISGDNYYNWIRNYFAKGAASVGGVLYPKIGVVLQYYDSCFERANFKLSWVWTYDKKHGS
eukprot:TRINITY_DN14761_c0_g1_i1.p1 TRINITY_DN14761_c0_g1~~TRINITY_DN14761_c0_g1_i1.p1  ORF type:complete len:198 (+),score=15.85 TRINITY_DN14761_c0_g1_i1:169-762(+)